MICTTYDMNDQCWLVFQDDHAHAAVAPVNDVMLGDKTKLHAMIGSGYVRITQVNVGRIAGPHIMWELQPSTLTEISTCVVPDLTHPLFIVSTIDRVIEGEHIPKTVQCYPNTISLISLRLPQEWTGSKEGRVFWTPSDRIYVHIIANDFFNGTMISQYMGMDIVLSFVEVKLFVQPPTAKFYPSEICVSISTTICSSIVATDFLQPALLSELAMGVPVPQMYVPAPTKHLNFVPQSSVSPSPVRHTPKKIGSQSPSKTSSKKRELNAVPTHLREDARIQDV